MDAKERYAAMIKDRLSPALRAEGLTGSGGRYAIPSDTHWALIGFQKSAFGDRDDVRFTFALLVVRKDDWAAAVAEDKRPKPVPSAITLYGDPVRSTRIGRLVGEGQDKWWQIQSGVEIEPVVTDVLDDLRSAGLPWLRDQL